MPKPTPERPLAPFAKRVLAMTPAELPDKIAFRERNLRALRREGVTRGPRVTRLVEEIALVNARLITYRKDMSAPNFDVLRQRKNAVREAIEDLKRQKHADLYRQKGLEIRSRLLAEREEALKRKRSSAPTPTRLAKAKPIPRLVVPARPEEPRPQGLFEGINYDLDRTSGPSRIYILDRHVITNYLKTLQLPNGARISEIGSGVSGTYSKGYETMQVYGTIATGFGDIGFDAELANDFEGRLQEIGHRVDLPFLLSLKPGMRGKVEGYISNMRNLLLEQISKRIRDRWQASNVALDAKSGNLAVTFRRKPKID